MLKEKVQAEIQSAIGTLVAAGKLPEAAAGVKPQVQKPGRSTDCDYASPVSMQLAKLCGEMSARDVGSLIVSLLTGEAGSRMFHDVEFADPGFINMTLKDEFLAEEVHGALDSLGTLHHTYQDSPEHYCVEFVSVNPNGPVTVGSGRGAALGDAVARVLQAAGHKVSREYYVNDGVNSEQMRLFGDSVKHHVLAKLGVASQMPENGYKGEYVEKIADELVEEFEPEFIRSQSDQWYRDVSEVKMLTQQRLDLKSFGVRFNNWVSERKLFDSGKVDAALRTLSETGMAVAKDGALWLRSTLFGDDQDRVLVRDDGRSTYIAGDIAYHQYKYERGYTRLVDVLGADHHGYIGRLKASVAAFGYDPESLEVLIFQTVRFVKDGQPQPMRKRDGNVYALIDLVKELGQTAAPDADPSEQVRIGSDMARFFYLNASHDRHMDFDISLAVSQSSQNPCFYAQYAHARARSILSKAMLEHSLTPDGATVDSLTALGSREERALAIRCLELPLEVARCAEDYGVHRLAAYAGEVSKLFHDFYEKHRVIQPDNQELSEARLALVLLAAEAVRQSLGLLGVSAPESMQRDGSRVALT